MKLLNWWDAFISPTIDLNIKSPHVGISQLHTKSEVKAVQHNSSAKYCLVAFLKMSKNITTPKAYIAIYKLYKLISMNSRRYRVEASRSDRAREFASVQED